MVPVIVLELDGNLDADTRLVQQADGVIALPAVMAHVHTVAQKYVKWKGGHEVSVSIGRQTVTRKVRADKKVESPRTFHFEERVTRLGTLEIKKPGKTVLKLKASQINRAVTNGLCVSEIRLEKI